MNNHINIQHYINNHDIDSGDFNVLYINIRSIRSKNKIDEIENIIQTTNYIIHAIIITETWLDKEDINFFNIRLYNHHASIRPTRSGGVSIFTHQSINTNEIHNECFENNNIIGIEIQRNQSKFNIFGIYKQPLSDKNIFLNYLQNIINKFKTSYYFGDFNLNILNTTCKYINQYIDTIYSNGHIILNNTSQENATRPITGTIIDHIITDQISNKFIINLQDTHISDHRYIQTNIKFQTNSRQQKGTPHNQINVIEYNKITQPEIIQIQQADTIESFITSISTILKKHTKIITQKSHTNKHKIKPWLSENTINFIKTRNAFYKLKVNYPHNTFFNEQFITYRNKVNYFIKNEKQNYFVNKFNDCMDNNKKFWQITNEILFNKKNCKPTQNITLTNNNTNTNNIKDVTNLFNDFFTQIGNNIVQITQNQIIPLQYNTTSNLYLYPTTPNEITKIIFSLNKNSANGHDAIPIKFFRNFANELSKKLSTFVNDCFKNGHFPDILKISKVSPIYKTGNKQNVSNYRPISVLPSCTKIFEKAILNRLEIYLVNNNIIHERQFGFVKSSSTTSACMHLMNFIEKNIDKHKIVGCIFIDLSKAYDTVNINILVEKLQRIGITHKALDLFKSYHKNRFQFVEINKSQSEKKLITSGVAQGSMISAPEFSIYINEIFYLNLHGEVQMYADDAVIMYSCEDVANLTIRIQDDIMTINNWLEVNSMKMNMEKTKYIIFDKHIKHDIVTDIYLKNCKIERVFEVKYLGLLIDSKLNWHSHINKVKNRIRSVTFAIRRLRDFIHSTALKNIYNAYILNEIIYLNPIWNNAALTKMNELKIIQNTAVKAIFKLPHLHPTASLYTLETKILAIESINKTQLAILIYKIKHNYIKHNFEITYRHNTHNYPTSHRNAINLPQCNTNTGLKTILYRGIKIFNELPDNITNCKSISIFKKLCTSHFQIHISDI